MAHHTLTNGSITATLPADMSWGDEYQFTPVVSAVIQSLDGGVIVEQSVRSKGRPITLSGDENRGWLVKSELDKLYGIGSTPGTLSLTLADGRQFNVMFAGQTPIKARGVWPLSLPTASDFYVVELSLVQV